MVDNLTIPRLGATRHKTWIERQLDSCGYYWKLVDSILVKLTFPLHYYEAKKVTFWEEERKSLAHMACQYT